MGTDRISAFAGGQIVSSWRTVGLGHNDGNLSGVVILQNLAV